MNPLAAPSPMGKPTKCQSRSHSRVYMLTSKDGVPGNVKEDLGERRHDECIK